MPVANWKHRPEQVPSCKALASEAHTDRQTADRTILPVSLTVTHISTAIKVQSSGVARIASSICCADPRLANHMCYPCLLA